MSWLERSHLLQAIRALAGYAIFLSLFLPMAKAGEFTGDEGLRHLGLVCLIFAGVTVAAGIALQIIVTILSTLTGQEVPNTIFDERDRLIEQQALTTAFGIASFGTILGLAALWQGWGIIWAISIIMAGLVLAELAVDLIRFYRYWRGG